MIRIIRAAAAAAAVLLTAGCAPGFGSRIDVGSLISPGDAPALGMPTVATVRVEQFSDNRPYRELVRIAGRNVLPEGVVAARTTEALQDMLREEGYRVSQFRGRVIRGEVLDWVAEITPGFPASTGKASAAVRILVSDENDRPLYSASYDGSAEMSHPYLSESRAKKLLGTAMETALEGAAKDEGLRQALVGEVSPQPAQGW